MARKCYISFKTEDIAYKNAIQDSPLIDIVDRSLDQPIDSNNDDYIMQTIRRDYLADSTVTIHLIGSYGAECRGAFEQRFIKRELQGSLYNSQANPRNGLLGIVLPTAHEAVFRGSYACSTCRQQHEHVAINDSTVIREFSYNYYLPQAKCHHAEADRYCVLADWQSFWEAPSTWIERAFAKRSDPVAAKVRIYRL